MQELGPFYPHKNTFLNGVKGAGWFVGRPTTQGGSEEDIPHDVGQTWIITLAHTDEMPGNRGKKGWNGFNLGLEEASWEEVVFEQGCEGWRAGPLDCLLMSRSSLACASEPDTGRFSTVF